MSERGEGVGPIGCVVLARNEASTISTSIDGLLAQDVWDDAAPGSQIVVVANGCDDDTAEVARRRAEDSKVPIHVIDLAEGGKSLAWNAARTHLLTIPGLTATVFVDADVALVAPDVLRLLVDEIRAGAEIASCRPTWVDPPRLNPATRALLRIGTPADDPTWVWGGLYSISARTLADVTMPIGLALEDGFLRAMVTTDGLRSEPDASRVGRAPTTFHIERDPRLRTAFRRRVRLHIGVTINHALFSSLRAGGRGFDETETVIDEHAGHLIASQNEQDPAWMRKLLDEYRSIHRFPVPLSHVRHGVVPQRWSVAAAVRVPAKLAFEAITIAEANRQMRRFGGLGYW